MSGEGREDDEWLYGESADSIKEPGPPTTEPGDAAPDSTDDVGKLPDSSDAPADTPVAEGAETAEAMDEGSQDEARGRKRSVDAVEGGDDAGSSEERDETEESDSEDDVIVTIGDIKSATPGGYGKRPGAPPPDKKGKFSAEDFDGPGLINGLPAQDFNLDAIDDKPWRKPGADITDYFNYGFTEDTWKAYSDRQKRLRYEAGHQGHHQMSGDVKYIGVTGQQNIIFPKKFGMQGQHRKDGPHMNMMGMSMGVRRDGPSENTIQVMTADRREYSRKQFEMGPGMMGPPPFDMSIPPPQFPPRGGEFMGPPPEFFNHPPPSADYYNEGPEYEEQQWMDSQWEMEGDGGRMGAGPSNALVVPLTTVTEVPPPPGETPDEGNPGVQKESRIQRPEATS